MMCIKCEKQNHKYGLCKDCLAELKLEVNALARSAYKVIRETADCDCIDAIELIDGEVNKIYSEELEKWKSNSEN